MMIYNVVAKLSRFRQNESIEDRDGVVDNAIEGTICLRAASISLLRAFEGFVARALTARSTFLANTSDVR